MGEVSFLNYDSAVRWAMAQEQFIWITSDLRKIKLVDVKSNHLVNIIKMIWNNTVPISCLISPVKYYSLDFKKHGDYYKRSLYEISKELARREDLSNLEIYYLRRMSEYIRGKKLQLEFDRSW